MYQAIYYNNFIINITFFRVKPSINKWKKNVKLKSQIPSERPWRHFSGQVDAREGMRIKPLLSFPRSEVI